MPQQLGNNIYYTTSEVAQVLNKSVETARGRIKEGLIKARNVNHGFLVSHDELVRHLDEYEALPESIISMRLNEEPVSNIANAEG